MLNLTDLSQNLRRHGVALEWVEETGSTNSDLLERVRSGALRQPTVRVALRQTAGRGTHGRTWSGVHRCAMFSLAWPWPRDVSSAGLSLAVGVVMIEAIAALLTQAKAEATHKLGLKWPNDLWLDGRKLGGILVESRQGAQTWVVIGVGVNVDAPADVPGTTGLVQALAEPQQPLITSERVLEALIAPMPEAMGCFVREGLPAFAPRWASWDVLSGCSVRIEREGAPDLMGVADGIDAQGALRVRMANRNGEKHAPPTASIVSGRVFLADPHYGLEPPA